MVPTRLRRKALVLGDDVRAFIGVVRSLGRGNVEVHIGWQPTDSLVRHSRYVHRAHALPAYSPDDDCWKAALIDLMQREAFDLVMPCSDPAQIPLQTHRRELEPFGRIYLLDDPVFRTVSDKFAVNALARAAGVRVPRERLVRHRAEAEEIGAFFQLPVVLKPRASHDPRRVGRRQEVRKVYHWQELDRQLAEMLASGPVAVQENFIGQGVGVELLLNRGAPLLEFQHVRLHEPLLGGGSCYRQGVPVTAALREAALAILGPLQYTGVAMVEFKVNPVTGDWVFIEVNGRFWGSLPLAVASGADFPRALFELLVEGRTEFPQQPRSGLCCRNWSGDFQWQAANLAADRSDPTLATRPLRAVVGETVVNLLRLRERSDTLTLDDPLPGLAEFSRLALGVARGVGRRCRRRACSFRSFAGDLPGTPGALASAHTVLFVCKGNICRSPFARSSRCRSALRGKYFGLPATTPAPTAQAPPARLLLRRSWASICCTIARSGWTKPTSATPTPSSSSTRKTTDGCSRITRAGIRSIWWVRYAPRGRYGSRIPTGALWIGICKPTRKLRGHHGWLPAGVRGQSHVVWRCHTTALVIDADRGLVEIPEGDVALFLVDADALLWQQISSGNSGIHGLSWSRSARIAREATCNFSMLFVQGSPRLATREPFPSLAAASTSCAYLCCPPQFPH